MDLAPCDVSPASFSTLILHHPAPYCISSSPLASFQSMEYNYPNKHLLFLHLGPPPSLSSPTELLPTVQILETTTYLEKTFLFLLAGAPRGHRINFVQLGNGTPFLRHVGWRLPENYRGRYPNLQCLCCGQLLVELCSAQPAQPYMSVLTPVLVKFPSHYFSLH